jgi:hypothetical protein
MKIKPCSRQLEIFFCLLALEDPKRSEENKFFQVCSEGWSAFVVQTLTGMALGGNNLGLALPHSPCRPTTEAD